MINIPLSMIFKIYIRKYWKKIAQEQTGTIFQINMLAFSVRVEEFTLIELRSYETLPSYGQGDSYDRCSSQVTCFLFLQVTVNKYNNEEN